MSVARISRLAVWVVCLGLPPVTGDAQENPNAPPFPHPACVELLVGSPGGGQVTDMVLLDGCADWAGQFPEAEWDNESKEHFYYREGNEDGFPGGYAGYVVEDFDPNDALVIKVWDNQGGVGYHTSLLIAASEFGIVTAPYTRKFGYRCNGELQGVRAQEDETYEVEVSATPKAILEAAGLSEEVAHMVFDDHVPDCSSCCVGTLRGWLNSETDELAYTGFTLDPDLISPVLGDILPAELAFRALSEIYGSAKLTWNNLEEAIRAIDETERE